MSTRRRALAVLATGALALPLLATPAGAAPGDTPVPAEQSIAAFCLNAPETGFTDVGANDTFAQAIRCLAAARITTGGPEGRPATEYGPRLVVTRGSMATFIARLIDAADRRDRAEQIRALPAAGPNRFRDVPDDNVHVQSINRLAEARVVQGGAGGAPADQYVPNAPVTRAQMATFINKAVAYMLGQDPDMAGASTGLVAPNNADYYTDDETIQVHQPKINGITSAGIAIGVGGQRYNPDGDVTRAQMAGFLTRTLAELFDQARINTLLEAFVVTPRATATQQPTMANPDNSPLDNREFTATGLAPSVEYRITLVKADTATREMGSNNQISFMIDSAAGTTPRGNNLTATGSPTADITRVNGAAPQNNTGRGTALTATMPNQTPSAVALPNAQGVITFTIDGDSAPEDIIVLVYVNGGPAGRSNADGGESPRLEIDGQGRPVEFIGVSGRTNFR